MMAAACGPQVTDLDDNAANDPSATPTPVEPGPEASIGMAISTSLVELQLRDLQPVEFVLTGLEGFTGDVEVVASNLPAGVTAEPVTVTIPTADTPVNGLLELVSTQTDAVPGDYSGIVLTATAKAGTTVEPVTGLVDATLLPVLVMQTRSDVAGNQDVDDYWGADATGEGIVIHMGGADSVEVSFENMTTGTHLIHGNGDAGMEHGDGAEGAPGAVQTRVLTPDTLPMTIDFYCHDHGEAIQPGRITLKP